VNINKQYDYEMPFEVWRRTRMYLDPNMIKTSFVIDQLISDIFGIHALYLDFGYLRDDLYKISDEKKFMQFLLKFS